MDAACRSAASNPVPGRCRYFPPGVVAKSPVGCDFRACGGSNGLDNGRAGDCPAAAGRRPLRIWTSGNRSRYSRSASGGAIVEKCALPKSTNAAFSVAVAGVQETVPVGV